MTKNDYRIFGILGALGVITIGAISYVYLTAEREEPVRENDVVQVDLSQQDSFRKSDITELAIAMKIYQLDNQGQNLPSVTALNQDTQYLIGSATDCKKMQSMCQVEFEGCVDLSGLTENLLDDIPVSPSREDTWSDAYTGYVLSVSERRVTVTACESESGELITITK